MSKMIGIRVPDDSTLPERLRGISNRQRAQYYELLERWITQEESEVTPGQLPINFQGAELEDLRARVEVLETQAYDTLPGLAEILRSRIDALEALACATPISAKVTKPPSPARVAESKNAPGDTRRADIIKRIRDLLASGHSLRGVADALNAEGIPTFSGAGIWQSGTIAKLIKKS